MITSTLAFGAIQIMPIKKMENSENVILVDGKKIILKKMEEM